MTDEPERKQIIRRLEHRTPEPNRAVIVHLLVLLVALLLLVYLLRKMPRWPWQQPKPAPAAAARPPAVAPPKLEFWRPAAGGPVAETAGWPPGLERGPWRFPRLRYGGPGWDLGMTEATGAADRNFLLHLGQETRLPVNGESVGITPAQLSAYRRGYAPPFLFVTGNGELTLEPEDLVRLRTYLDEGGMLLADCPGADWGRQFKVIVVRIYPEGRFEPVPRTDPLFLVPYAVTNAPPGDRGEPPLGLRDEDGRWLAFLWPGPLNQTWRGEQPTTSLAEREAAFRLGVNLVHYAFWQYYRVTASYRPAAAATGGPVERPGS